MPVSQALFFFVYCVRRAVCVCVRERRCVALTFILYVFHGGRLTFLAAFCRLSRRRPVREMDVIVRAYGVRTRPTCIVLVRPAARIARGGHARARALTHEP